MENKATDLRQADTKLEVIGVLSEKTLKEEIDKDGKRVIRGDMTIQTGEYNFVKFNVYCNELTNAGKVNSAYEGLKTVIEQYQSIAEVGRDNATVVRVNRGQIQPNSYLSPRTGNIEENVRYRASYFTRVQGADAEPSNFKAEFEAEVYIDSIVDEISTNADTIGEPTGRKLLKGWMPMYNNGIEPIVFVIPEDLADAVESGYSAGETVNVLGIAVNERIEKVHEIPVKIGKPKKEVRISYNNSLVLTGITEAYDETRAYDPDVIKKAIAEREIRLEEMKSKPSAKSSAPSKKASPVAGRPIPKF